jgi:hypothetical protein
VLTRPSADGAENGARPADAPASRLADTVLDGTVSATRVGSAGRAAVARVVKPTSQLRRAASSSSRRQR